LPRSSRHDPADRLKRRVLGALAILLLADWGTAVCALAQAASPFPQVPLAIPKPRSHLWDYVILAGGAGLVGSSFIFKDRADDSYDAYLRATDPDQIDHLYGRTIHQDRLSRAALLGGEALLATGIYLRFIRRPVVTQVGLAVGPRQCAVSLRF
jgi:hypothetical protein